jgi:hypothetical protein
MGYMLVIPALKKLRKRDHDSKASLGYIAKPFLKNNNKNQLYKITTTTTEKIQTKKILKVTR